jgi:hypothetical protein
MNKPNIFPPKTYKKIHHARTRKAFADAIRAYNAKVPEREKGKRGLNPDKINHPAQVEGIISYVCANASKIVNGVMKFTRTHAAAYLGVSTPTVDRYLDVAGKEKLGWIQLKDKGLCTFPGGDKAIGCLYVAFDMNKFVYEEVKIEKNVDKPKPTKNSKSASNGDNWDSVKEFLLISPS